MIMKYTIKKYCLFEVGHSDMNYILFFKLTYQYYVKKIINIKISKANS